MSSAAYRETHKEKVEANKRAYRATNKEKITARDRAYLAENVRTASDGYIRHILKGFGLKTPTPELIEMNRLRLLVMRRMNPLKRRRLYV